MFILDLFIRRKQGEKTNIELNDFLEDNIKKKKVKKEEVKEYEPDEVKDDEPDEVKNDEPGEINEVVNEVVNEEEVNDIDLKITKKDEDAMCYNFQERVLYYVTHPLYFLKILYESVVQLKWKL